MTDILQKIKQLRLAHNWTEYELSLQSGIPQNTISAWYRKGQTPTIYSLEKICKAFDISLSALLSQENELIALSDTDHEFLKQINQLTPSQKEYFLQFLESFFTEHGKDLTP